MFAFGIKIILKGKHEENRGSAVGNVELYI